jgi:hypothetical protein
MPVVGYTHVRVWEYNFPTLPVVPLLDPDWDDLQEWQFGMVERLQRGGPAPVCLSVYDILQSDGYGTRQAGWEATEDWAKNAVRSGAVFLNDAAIARRLPERELRKKGYAEFQTEQKALWEKQEARRAEEEAALVEAHRAAQERTAERARIEVEQATLWLQRQTEIDAEIRRRPEERAGIMSHGWQCKRCLGLAKIEQRFGRYVLTCLNCGAMAEGDRAMMLGMMSA